MFNLLDQILKVITGALHKDLTIFQRELHALKGDQAMKSLKVLASRD